MGSLVFGFGLFFTLFFLFCRFLPFLAMSEVKAVVMERRSHGEDH
jgi:molybdopterin-containing oxidoreductase family membrane subunit